MTDRATGPISVLIYVKRLAVPIIRFAQAKWEPPMSEDKRQQTHISEMMLRLGIEPGCAAVSRWGPSFTTAFHRCESCDSKQSCRDWLAGQPEPHFAPRFCPNADILFEMRADQPGIGPAPERAAAKSPGRRQA